MIEFLIFAGLATGLYLGVKKQKNRRVRRGNL